MSDLRAMLPPAGVETVAVAVPDSVGRLMGKRIPVNAFQQAAEQGLAMPDYFLVTWLDNHPQGGLEVTGPQTGWPNALLLPDLPTLRQIPWEPSSALVLCNTILADGRSAPMASRELLSRQVGRAEQHDIHAVCASELEFWLFDTPYRVAAEQGYRHLVTSHHRVQDNDLLQAGADEDFISLVRRYLPDFGVEVAASLGEGGAGQHEINLCHTSISEMADRTVLYKHALKDLAYRAGKSITFMSKWCSARASSSGHVHISLFDTHGRPLLWDESDSDLSAVGKAFLSGLLRYTPELMVLHAPFVNSYKRLCADSFAPLTCSWGRDNRTVCFRLIGTGSSFRIECRMPGADANPYWSFAALLIAGLAGIEQDLTLPQVTSGDAGAQGDLPILPRDLSSAFNAFQLSDLACRSLGAETYQHISRLLGAELEASRHAVSEWELARGFEAA